MGRHMSRVSALVVTHPSANTEQCCLTSMIKKSHTLPLCYATGCLIIEVKKHYSALVLGWMTAKALTRDMCLPMGIISQHNAGKFGNLLLALYWAAHSWKWHMCSVRDACRNRSEMDTQDTVETLVSSHSYAKRSQQLPSTKTEAQQKYQSHNGISVNIRLLSILETCT